MLDELAKIIVEVGVGVVRTANGKKKFRDQVARTGEVLFCEESWACEVGDWYQKEGFTAATPKFMFITAKLKNEFASINLAVERNGLSFNVVQKRLNSLVGAYTFLFTFGGKHYEMGVPRKHVEFVKVMGVTNFRGLDNFPALQKALAG